MELPVKKRHCVPKMHTRAKMKIVASDRVRRTNVPRHILFNQTFTKPLRKCGNIWNLCEVFPARLTEKCLCHYNGYDVGFMQKITKPAVGEKKNMTKKQKRMLRNRSRRRRIRKQLLATARTRKAISEADFEGTATRM